MLHETCSLSLTELLLPDGAAFQDTTRCILRYCPSVGEYFCRNQLRFLRLLPLSCLPQGTNSASWLLPRLARLGNEYGKHESGLGSSFLPKVTSDPPPSPQIRIRMKINRPTTNNQQPTTNCQSIISSSPCLLAIADTVDDASPRKGKCKPCDCHG